jgi:hypothetical protein
VVSAADPPRSLISVFYTVTIPAHDKLQNYNSTKFALEEFVMSRANI